MPQFIEIRIAGKTTTIIPWAAVAFVDFLGPEEAAGVRSVSITLNSGPMKDGWLMPTRFVFTGTDAQAVKDTWRDRDPLSDLPFIVEMA